MEKKMTGADMATRFNPQEIEADIYKAWEESGAFTAHRVEGKKPFTIVIAAQHYRPAPYGSCDGLYPAGRTYPLSPDEG